MTLTIKQLQDIKGYLEYLLEDTEDEHGYDRESFFADRHWSQIEHELRGLIKAVEVEMGSPE